MDEDTKTLDLEYKRYLQIMRPYLGQLVDEDVINICNAWIKRLSNSSEQEKPMRNKYVFVLCYQLAKGIIDVPFLHCPPVQELPPIPKAMDSDSSTETVEYLTDGEDNNTKILFNTKKPLLSNTEYLSQDIEYDKCDDNSSKDFDSKTFDEKSSKATRKQTIFCYTCPEMIKTCAEESTNEKYEFRAQNLIMKLREIKNQNMLLHNELVSLKEDCKLKPCEIYDSLVKIDNATNASRIISSATLKTLNNKLQEYEEDKQNLLDTIKSLKEQLDNFHQVKIQEIEDMEAKHKLEIIKIKASVHDESKSMYDEKLEDLMKYNEILIKEIKQNTERETQTLNKHYKDILAEKDNNIEDMIKTIVEKDKEIHKKDKIILDLSKELQEKVTTLQEKEKTLDLINKIILAKDTEIASLKTQAEEQSNNLHKILSKIKDKPQDDSSSNSTKIKAHEYEKRLIKMEKSKTKCAKIYESKLAHFQREKHLAECSLQLQLVRHRAQVINEVADENQTELSAALDKLEAKYKDIVANVQSTAIQRKMQDQLALDSILQAACGLKNEISNNQSQFSGKTVTIRPKKENLSYDSEISGMMRNNTNNNKSFGDDIVAPGYCLDGERFGQLFEKIHIPQRDVNIGDLPIKK